MLRLLEQEELGVGELAKIIQLPQSTVSRHLKALDQGRWIVRRAEGTSSLVRLVPDRLPTPLQQLWEIVRTSVGQTTEYEEDTRRLKSVIGERRLDARTFFGRVGADWGSLRRQLFGETFTLSTLLALTSRPWVVGDFGCGTGDTTAALAPFVKKVIGVDREQSMLDVAERRIGDLSNVELRLGDLIAPPVEDNELDAIVCMLTLHHIESPELVMEQMVRVLKPGGKAVILDMVKHARHSYALTMGHVHLGFAEENIAGYAKAGGMKLNEYRMLRPSPDAQGPGLFIALLSA
jgi:ArsR family transcriptional regulator